MKKGKIVELRNNSVYMVTELRKNIHFFNKSTLVLEWSEANNCYFFTIKDNTELEYKVDNDPISPGQMHEAKTGTQISVQNVTTKKKSLFVVMSPEERYFLGEIIGRNGIRTKFTCKALDVTLRSRVIIKLHKIPNANVDQMRVQKFRRSARAHSRLTSPYLAQLRDVGEKIIRGVVYEYQVYDYFVGETLDKWKEQNCLSGEDGYGKAVKIFHQVALALRDMQASGVAHRNLSEKHVLVDQAGRVHIVGMSLLKSNDTELTLSGEILEGAKLFPREIEKPFWQDVYVMIVLFVYTITDLNINNIFFPIELKETCKNYLPGSLVTLIESILKEDFPTTTELVSVFAEAAKFAPHNINRKQQYLVIPDVSELNVPVNMDVWYRPLEEVGGDFYDVISSHKNKMGFLIGDAMGHGIKASLYCHMIQPVARVLSSHQMAPPAQILEQMNSLLYRSKGPMRFSAFATAQYVALTLTNTSKYLIYANAGHPFPIICRDGIAKLATPENNMFCGNKLGMNSNKNFCCFENCIELISGDFLILYTDGIIEVKNEKEEEYTQDRLLQVLSQDFENSQQVLAKVQKDVAQFCDENYSDDLTFLAIEIL